MTEDPAEFVRSWCEFGDNRTYILMAIARRKHNDDITNSSEVIHRRVLTSEEDVDGQVGDLSAMMNRHDLKWRLYLTVNAHDRVSAFHAFVQQLVGWYEEILNTDPVHADVLYDKMGLIGSEWKSQLHKPEHTMESYFLIDYDNITREGVKAAVASLNEETQVQEVVETPNGFHVITRPFEYPSWECPVGYDDLSTSGMVFVMEVDNRRGDDA